MSTPTHSYCPARTLRPGLLALSLAGALLLSGLATPARLAAQTNVYWIGGSDFNYGLNWVGGVAPGSSSVAVFDVATSKKFRLTADISVAGLALTYNGSLNITPGSTLTVGSSGITNSTTNTSTKTLGMSIALGADQTFTNNGVLTQSGTLNLSTHALTYTGTGTGGTISGVISGTGSLTKTGTGSLTLSAANTYTGATTVSAGTLTLGSSASLASSSITVASGATLATTSLSLGSGKTLGGSGTVSGALTIGSGATIAPGNSPGTLSTGNTTFAGGGTFQFEVNDANGSAGTNYDLLAISGTLTLTATSGSPFTLDLTSLTSGNSAGLADNFDSASDYAFTFITTTGGISGFSADQFSISTANFTNPFSGTWSVGLSNSGNDLTLYYAGVSAVPEPSTYAVLFGVAALGAVAWRKRRPA